MAVLVDITKCIGCGACEVACKLWNKLPYRKKEDEVRPRQKDDLSDVRWTAVKRQRLTDAAGERQLRFVKTQCMHCTDPACVSACFSTALRVDENGAVVYYPSLCVGCRYCMVACPFKVPRYQWEERFPLITKCNQCAARLREGKMPACVSVCPSGALTYGTRDELLARAHALLAKDARYVDHIYGEHEVGGTKWLYIADRPFADLGFAKVTDTPPSAYAQSYLTKVPIVAGLWALFLVGLSFFHYCREHSEETKLYHKECRRHKEEKADKDKEERA